MPRKRKYIISEHIGKTYKGFTVIAEASPLSKNGQDYNAVKVECIGCKHISKKLLNDLMNPNAKIGCDCRGTFRIGQDKYLYASKNEHQSYRYYLSYMGARLIVNDQSVLQSLVNFSNGKDEGLYTFISGKCEMLILPYETMIPRRYSKKILRDMDSIRLFVKGVTESIYNTYSNKYGEMLSPDEFEAFIENTYQSNKDLQDAK